jgi:hypothetical protein
MPATVIEQKIAHNPQRFAPDSAFQVLAFVRPALEHHCGDCLSGSVVPMDMVVPTLQDLRFHCIAPAQRALGRHVLT